MLISMISNPVFDVFKLLNYLLIRKPKTQILKITNSAI